MYAELNQHLFTTAVTGILAQGTLSKDENNNCFYRGPNRTKCAVGHLMDDEYFEPWMNDDVNIGDNDVRSAVLKSQGITHDDFPYDTWTFLDRLQMAHDNAANMDAFVQSAQHLAIDYDLNMPERPQEPTTVR